MSQSTLPPTPYTNSSLFSGYYLAERVADLDEWDCDGEAVEAFEDLRDLYDEERDLLSTYNEDMLIDAWIDEVVEVLGFDKISETALPDGGGYVDGLLFGSTEDRRTAVSAKQGGNQATMYERASALVEAKQWDADFEGRFHEGRNYRDASHQIKYYLERTPDGVSWGVLTNGRKWRLYGTKDYETQTYYEVDLPELLETGNVEQFKYFYVFFRAAAFRETAGTTFLDEVWAESETAAQELGEDLQDNVFTALRVLGRGFVETNDLGIDPADEAARGELKEQSLVLLYRLMFILYAESRDLINPDDPDAKAEYVENFSLDKIRQEILDARESGETFDEAYSEYSTSLWSRLQNLFALIDEGEEDLGIPPYNGGLFDKSDHEFLAANEVSDRYLAEVIYRLSTTKSDDGEYVLADYADLDTRHLGTIYEGLLEHEFRIAPEQYAAVSEDGGQVWKPATEVSVADAVETVDEGGLYVVNDDGERKATGAYYTPDYVVTYIVEETVGPLVDDIEDELRADGLDPSDMEYFRRLWQSVKDLRVLDPAMGSGHFLTKATAYLTERVMSVVRELELQTFNEQEIRRGISKECIYGVDLNGMAVELAKLSMWLETLAADQPLAFLDHHLKAGNSLIGSDIEEIEELESGDADTEEGQYQLGDFDIHRRGTIEHLMEVYQEFLAIENENIEDVQAMKRKYREIEQDDLRQRLVSMANVHTAERFDLDVPSGAYERMAGNLNDDAGWAKIETKDWFKTAQAMADDHDFLHWKLEFPEVFYGAEGEAREDGGFDAVVGNPPYIKIQNLKKANPEFVDYSMENFSSSGGRFDIYALFVEKGVELAHKSNLGYILPNKFFESGGGEGLRELLQEAGALEGIVDFGKYQVFEGVTTYTCILRLNQGSDSFQYFEVDSEPTDVDALRSIPSSVIEIEELGSKNWALTGPKEREILDKMRVEGTEISEMLEYLSEGIVSGDNKVLFVEIVRRDTDYTRVRCELNDEEYVLESELVKPLLKGDDIHRYESPETDVGVIYPYEIKGGEHSLISEPRLKNEFPDTFAYLSEHKERLADRGTGNMRYNSWYALYRSREKQLFESQKLITPDICQKPEFMMDDGGGVYLPDTGYGLVFEEEYEGYLVPFLAILNSKITWFYIYHTSPVLRGDFRRFKTSYLGPLPVPDLRENVWKTELEDDLSNLANQRIAATKDLMQLNLELTEYLSFSSNGSSLNQTGLYQPPKNSGDNILAGTKEDYDSLRIGDARVTRTGDNTVAIEATARYKPENEADYETDRWGYTETGYLEAFRLTDLTERELDLIREFVPVAVDEAGGFANFRETATKTNSLINRLKKLTLPDPEAVADELDAYLEAKARAEELDEKIEQTDALIDEIVYELYGLTDEEIAIVEDAVADD